MGSLNGRYSKEAKAIVGIWFGRYWTREDLQMLADTIEIGLEARASRNKHTGDLTDDQRLIMDCAVNSIKARAL